MHRVHTYHHEASNCVPAKALVLSFTKLLKETVKHSKTNRHFTQMHCSANIYKKLLKHMFMTEDVFNSTAKHVCTKWKTANGHSLPNHAHTTYVTQI